jgi:hypothetical protein
VKPYSLASQAFGAQFCRIALNDGSTGNVPEDHTPGTYDSAGTNFNTRADESLGGNPTTPPQENGLGYQGEVFAPVIVRTRADKGALGNANAVFYGHACQVQKVRFLSDPDMVADHQTPGQMNVHLGADDDAAADLGSE